MEHGIKFDGVIGVSAGAIHGCSYLSNQHGRSIRYYKNYCSDPRFMSFRSWLKTGNLVETEFCYHQLPEQLDVYDYEAFDRSGIPFYVTCSNVETGKAEYVRVTDMRSQIDYIRASASLPYFSRIVEINGNKFLDGGCTDSIPVEAFRKMGYGRNVVVLTRDIAYRKKQELQTLPNLVYWKYPKFAQALANRHIAYNESVARLRQLERGNSVFVIRPSQPLDIGRMETDPENVERVYSIGRADALKRLDALMEWL